MASGFLVWWNFIAEDKFDKMQRQLAGPMAVNLGRAHGYNVKLHEACVAAFQEKRPFRARFDGRHSDDCIITCKFSVSSGIVGTPDGQIYYVFLSNGHNQYLKPVLVPKPYIVTYNDGSSRISSRTQISIPEPFD